MRGKRGDSKDGGGRATQETKAEFTGVNDRLSRARPMSIANALGAFLPRVGVLTTPYGSERAFMQRFQVEHLCV